MSARTPQEEAERMRNLLSFLLVGAFISVLPVFTFKVIPADNKDIITYMVGQLSGMATMALGFYFTNKVGQDALDSKRADNTGKLAEATTAALALVPGGEVANAGNASKPAENAVAEAAKEVAGAATERADEIAGEKP